MPRQPRLNVPGVFHHIMVRGIERRKIFRAASDYADFLKRLGEGILESGCRCFGWALMPNHLHLLVLSGVRGITSLMHPLLTGYAVTFNLKYDRVGHLFQNRYKSILCEENPYFLELLRYIALNPVRANIVHSPEELARYPWTSHSAVLGRFSLPWLDVDYVLGRFGATLTEARAAYERFILEKWTQGYRDDLEGGGLLRSVGGVDNACTLRRLGKPEMSDVRILGSGRFVETILQTAEREDQANRILQKTCSKESLQTTIAELTGIDSPLLVSRDRSRPVAAARAMLVYAATEWLGLSGKQVAKWLSISASAVAQARTRARPLVEERQLLSFLGKRT